MAQTPPDRAALADSARALRQSGTGAFRSGTRAGLERAILIWKSEAHLERSLGDPSAEGTTLNNIGFVFDRLGQLDSAIAYYRRALPLVREAGDRATEGRTLINIAVALGGLGQPDSALVYYRRTLSNVRESGDRAAEAMTLSRMGATHGDLGQPDSALAYYREALPILREVGDRAGEGLITNRIGSEYERLEQPDSALAYHRAALSLAREVGDRMGEGVTLHNIGAVYQRMGQPDSALAYMRRSLPIRRALRDRGGEGQTLGDLGAVHGSLGRADSALVYLRRSLPLRRAAGDRVGEGTTLGNIGSQYWGLGQVDSAFAYLGAALRIQREVGDRKGEAGTLSNIGLFYHYMRRPDSALVYLRGALPIMREVGDREGEGVTLGSLGGVYNGLGRQDSALVYLREARQVTREIGDRTSEALALNRMGNAYGGLGRPDSALAYYREALGIRREVGHPVGESVTLWNLGFLHHRQLDTPDLATATAYYDSASAMHGVLAGGTGSDALRLSFEEQDADAYQLWTLAWLARGAEVGEEVARLSALAASERGRGQAALALMRDSLVIQPGQDLAAKGRSLAAAITDGGATGLSYLVTGDTLLVWLIPPAGEVQVARRQIAADTVAALVDQLRLDLGVDEATRSGLALEPGPREGPDVARGTRRAARAGGWPGEAAHRLSELVLPAELRPLLAEAGELVILPHGSLNLLPFAALPLGGEGVDEGVDEGEYLGSRHAIRYAPSLAILDEARGRSTGAGDPLIVGNPDMPVLTTSDGTRERLSPLAGAETEAQWLGDQLGQASMTGQTATESAVRARLPGASLVHLATHGFAYGSEARARDSFVALAPGPDEDGLLTVGEVLDEVPQLQADLVVLSACQTGLGDLKQAEGTVGLQRAFLAKGARSVLVSLWSVSDEATTLLMQRFYTHWLGLERGAEPGLERGPEGESEARPGKAEALRRAQEDVRATPGFEHPRFWAAFQLVGAN